MGPEGGWLPRLEKSQFLPENGKEGPNLEKWGQPLGFGALEKVLAQVIWAPHGRGFNLKTWEGSQGRNCSKRVPRFQAQRTKEWKFPTDGSR